MPKTPRYLPKTTALLHTVAAPHIEALFLGSRTDKAMSIRSPQRPLLGHILQWRILWSLFFCLALALAPSLAEARAGSSYSSGGSSSMGSRGTRTFENNGAAPVTRSMTQTPSTSPLAGAAGAGAGALGGGSFFQRHP